MALSPEQARAISQSKLQQQIEITEKLIDEGLSNYCNNRIYINVPSPGLQVAWRIVELYKSKGWSISYRQEDNYTYTFALEEASPWNT